MSATRDGHRQLTDAQWQLVFERFNNSNGNIPAHLFNYTHVMADMEDPMYDSMQRPQVRWTIVTLYVIVIVVGLLGNALVIGSIVKVNRKNMKRTMKIFIVTLAVSDIGLCAFSLPVQLHYQLTNSWVLGDVMCRVVFAAFAVPLYVSNTTILFIAYFRFRSLSPRLDVMESRMAVYMISGACALALTLAFPVMKMTSLHRLQNTDLGIDVTFCVEQWPDEKLRSAYSLVVFLAMFCIPVTLTALFYLLLCIKMRKMDGSRHVGQHARTNRMLCAIVVIYIVCWMPWNLFSLVVELRRDAVAGAHFKLIDLLLKLFAMASSCINPLLYVWLNTNVRTDITSNLRLRTFENGGFDRRRGATAGVKAGVKTVVNEGGQSAVAVETQRLLVTSPAKIDESRMSLTPSHMTMQTCVKH